MDLIKIVTQMVEVRQDIEELSRKVEERTRKLDLLIDGLIEFMKHRGLVETRKVSSKKPSEGGT